MKIKIRGLRKGEFATVIVDDDFPDSLAKKRWFIGTDGYARRIATKIERLAGAPAVIAMHREILGLHLKKGRVGEPEVDHVNRDRLDNRRANLRIVSRSLNSFNKAAAGRSPFIGVSFFKPASLWRAYINVGGKRLELGYFKTEQAAAEARDRAARKYYPGQARLNFPEEGHAA